MGVPAVLTGNLAVLVLLAFRTHLKLWAVDKVALRDAHDEAALRESARARNSGMSLRHRGGAAAVASILLLTVPGCGGDDTPDTPEGRGAALAAELGCASCHGPEGQGGFGPVLADIIGTTVELADGTTAVVDTAYLQRSILDPQAQIVPGFTAPMPATNPSAEQLADLIAWIESLSA